MLVLLFKKTIMLFALVEPLTMVPFFLSASADMTPAGRQRFALALGATVTLVLMLAGAFGRPVLGFFGISMGAMQLAGGLIALMLSVAMVLGMEIQAKSTHEEATEASSSHRLVPLAVPLLAGPAAFAFVMTSAESHTWLDVGSTALAVLLVGLATWLTFAVAARTQHRINPGTLAVVERLAGFLLAALSVEMMAMGIKALFPGVA